ncbi:MAG TPA: HEPN domain-containing protein [Actinomycetales bacterium]|nr:HEPN domain-containing protein [Actinomycetales bacterium]
MSVPRGRRFAGSASQARIRFYDASDDVRSYYTVAQALKDRRGLTRHVSAVGRGTYVLVAALWEGFCEDFAHEAAKALVSNVSGWSDLPPALARRISLEVKDDKHELSAWTLSGDGWRVVALDRVDRIARSTIFNTPKTHQVDQLFKEALGIECVSQSWVSAFAQGESPSVVLDRAMTLRGAIAHGEERERPITKKDVSLFYQLIADLVDSTELHVSKHLERSAGLSLWRCAESSTTH